MTFQARFCPQCGQRRTGYFRFCGVCGFDFDELQIGSPSQAQASPPIPTPAQWPTSQPAPVAQLSLPLSTPESTTASPEPEPDPVTGWVPPVPVRARRPAVTGTRVAIITLAALLGLSAISRAVDPSTGPAPTAAPTVAVGTPPLVGSPAAVVTPGPSYGPTGEMQSAVVTRIVDGDTIHVDIEGRDYPLRYIGIDAPEPDTADPAIKQLADAATAANAALVDGREVLLERDVSDTDRFDRLLRNVWFVDRGGSMVFVNLELVRLGFAQVTTFPPDEKYVDHLTAAQDAARADGAGLWASAPTAVPTAAAAPKATPKTLVGGGSNCHPSYTPCLPIVADLDCADVREMGKAPVTVKGPDEYRLDGSDNDGLGCE